MATPLHLLIVEDSADDAALMVHELQSAGFDPIWTRVETESDYRAALGPHLDLIFADHNLPQFSGYRALELLLETKLPVPFVVVSGTIGEERAVECLKAGATDVVLKNHFERLEPVVHRALREAQERSERKRAEEAGASLVRRNELFFRALGELAYDHDLVADRIEWAGNAPKCVGWAIEELGTTRQAWIERIHPDDRPRVLALFDQPVSDQDFSIEYRFRHLEGHDEWIFDRGVMLADAGGRVDRVIGIMWNITERKRAEAALRESEARFRQLAETIVNVFWMTDPAKNQMLYVSPAYETIWGRSCESLYASPRTWMEAIHPDDRPRVSQAAATRQVEGKYDEVYRIVRPDGAVRWIRDAAFPIRDTAGTVYRVVGLAEDITKERSLEDQLRQGQKMESIGLLAGGVAHDFNNILTVIQINASTLRLSRASDADTREAAEQISLAAERAASLTRQLLTFSRKQVVNPQSLDLNEVVGNLTKMLKRILGEDVLLHVKCHVSAPVIHADVGMLEQVLMNLAVNARDAMPRGGQLIVTTSLETIDADYVKLHPQARAGDFVCLAVSDTGEGIPASILPRIFEPFFTTKEVGKGTGLGLATVYGIVQQHQGWITVYSEVGQGTVFRIYLPAIPAPGRKVERPAPPTALPGGTETVLLVEDEKAVRTLARMTLERHGYTVIEAESGAQALQIWPQQRDQINLVLTDLVMPGGVTGRELVQRLQAERPSLPVIYSSGYSVEMAGMDFELLEGVNFLQKPYSIQKIAQTVRQALDQARNPAAGRKR